MSQIFLFIFCVCADFALDASFYSSLNLGVFWACSRLVAYLKPSSKKLSVLRIHFLNKAEDGLFACGLLFGPIFACVCDLDRCHWAGFFKLSRNFISVVGGTSTFVKVG